MATTSLFKPSPLLMSNRRQNLHGTICRMKAREFITSSNFGSMKVKSCTPSLSGNKNYTSILGGKNNSEVPSDCGEQVPRNNSAVASYSGEQVARSNAKANPVLKWLKIPAAVSLLLMMMMYGRNTAVARSVGNEYISPVTREIVRSYPAYFYPFAALFNGFSDLGETVAFFALMTFGLCFYGLVLIAWAIEATHVINLQVGLLVPGPALERGLREITRAVDSSTVSGRYYILEETIKVLLKHIMCCNAAYSSVLMSGDMENAKHLVRRAVQECEKLNERARVKFNDIKTENTVASRGTNLPSTYVVVTVLVVAGGFTVPNFPTSIADRENLRKALEGLLYVCDRCEAVCVLCNPMNEDVIMSPEELRVAYPLLGTFSIL